MKIDSNYSPKELILQNPHKPDCPEDILHSLGVMEVQYFGFDRTVHRGQIIVASSVMADVEAFFTMALELSFPIEKVVPVSAPPYRWNADKVLKDNLTSGFDYRLILGTNKISLHGRGRAFDVNPRQNPYIIYEGGKPKVVPADAAWKPDLPGTLHGDHQLVKLMKGLGWEWGGHWTAEEGRTDYMHFQK